MLDLDFTFIFTAINLVVLYLILKKVLFKRVTQFMEDRENSIVSAIEHGEARKAEGEAIKKEYEGRLLKAGQDIDELMQQAVKKANAEYESIIAQAKRDAEIILEKATQDIERERAALLLEVKDSVLSASFAAASKLLSINLDTKENTKLVEEFLNDEGAA